MNIDLPPDLESRLTLLAEQQGRSRTALVAEAVESFVDHDSWFRFQVQAGLDEISGGSTLSHEEVGRRLNRRYSGIQ